MLITLLFLAAQASAAQSDGQAGVIKSSEGGAEVTILNKDRGGTRKTKAQEPVYAGDKVVTAAGQSVMLTLADESEIIVGPVSSFSIEQFERKEKAQQTVLSAVYGTLRALVRKSYGDDETFAVKAPGAVMGVRGTEFVVQIDRTSRRTELHAVSGRVAMAPNFAALRNPAQSVLVQAGQMSFMTPGMRMPAAPKSFDMGQFRQKMQQQAPMLERAIGTPGAGGPDAQGGARERGAGERGDGRISERGQTQRQEGKRPELREGQGPGMGKGQGMGMGQGPGPGGMKPMGQGQGQGKGQGQGQGQGMSMGPGPGGHGVDFKGSGPAPIGAAGGMKGVKAQPVGAGIKPPTNIGVPAVRTPVMAPAVRPAVQMPAPNMAPGGALPPPPPPPR
jgi:hypothetical protein